MQSFPPEGLPLSETTKLFHLISFKAFIDLVLRGTSIQDISGHIHQYQAMKINQSPVFSYQTFPYTQDEQTIL